jgi:hypothetical protein
LVAMEAVSEWLQAKQCATRSARCITVQGGGGDVSCARCRAGMRAVRGWRRRACTGTLLHALRVLGGLTGIRRRGRGGVYGGSEVAAPRGIGHTRADELDGEVTSPGAVGAIPPKLGVHGGLGYGHGGVECSGRVTARWGRGLGASRVALVYWGSRAASG